MKTTQDLRARAKELSSLVTHYSKQGVELIHAGNRKEGHELMVLLTSKLEISKQS